jgi:hypothetical protein
MQVFDCGFGEKSPKEDICKVRVACGEEAVGKWRYRHENIRQGKLVDGQE